MARTPESTPMEIADFLSAHPHWTVEEDVLVRVAEAPGFRPAIAWVVAVADIAEELDHHPDIDIRWRTVTFRLTSHDLGRISARDLQLAALIDSVVAA
jgi:4a-hydroxytetrahydrobiopterin dehydratase